MAQQVLSESCNPAVYYLVWPGQVLTLPRSANQPYHPPRMTMRGLPRAARWHERQVFVGRELELEWIRAAFDAATAGHGSVVAIAGEPGIGKSGLCQQVASYVNSVGGTTLVGRCHEEGWASIPYMPFVEAIRGYLMKREGSVLAELCGRGASDIARIMPELREATRVEAVDRGDL